MQSNKLRLAIRATAAAAVLGITSQPALAQSANELQKQINDLRSQVSEMKAASDSKGWLLPGTNTSVTIGGYVKLDMIYDTDQDLGDLGDVTALDTSSDGGDASFRAHARQSRIRLGTSTPTELGEAKTVVEADFYGNGGNEVFSNSRSLRIRHAYGQLNGWLAGQTWSNFMQFIAYPSTVDFNGPVGVTFIRQAQLRYTMGLGDGQLSMSAENSETTGFAGARDTMPDLTARYKWSGSGGGFEVGALGRSFTSDTATGDDSAFGYGLMAAGRLNVTSDTTLMAGAIYGDGVGRYLYTSFSNNQSDSTRSGIGEAYIGANGDLETIEAYGFNVAASHAWTPKFTTSLSYGFAEGDQDEALFPNSFKTLQSAHLSNFYQVADPVTVGVEVSYQNKEDANGDAAENTRLQLAAQFSF
ncbi:hypothetical protein ACP86_05705 [Marinobacter sp. CP1]|jgi:hypothetical protein|uniref:DcaP family trimeric outer membrane transporter n=1 Tax=unclassified Marinobacter TaxID=83889 RepID=UPI00069FD0C9|nr:MULTISPECIES: DcaP family trimeric outer membrane transporter [unclassified Marinobacter]AKV95697.1 hypothetical protein ACP86_05705 [Marinobacter sp. CP1]